MRLLLILSMFTSSVFASKFDIDAYSTSLEYAQVTNVLTTQKLSGSWCLGTSVRHNDQGWEHYADGWEVMDLRVINLDNVNLLTLTIMSNPLPVVSVISKSQQKYLR